MIRLQLAASNRFQVLHELSQEVVADRLSGLDGSRSVGEAGELRTDENEARRALGILT